MQPNLKGTNFSKVVLNLFSTSVISQRGKEYPNVTSCNYGEKNITLYFANELFLRN